MKPHAVGMVPNFDDKLKGQAITVGKGAQVVKNGISDGTAVSNDVAHSPQMNYN